MNETELATITAAIDTEDIETQCSVIPDTAPGRYHLIMAVRACRRVRETAADAIALASEGRLVEALETSAEAAHHLDTMRQALATARENA